MSAVNNLSIFVTGANGFIGHALCEQASGLGFRVQAATRNPCKFLGQVKNVLIPSFGKQAAQENLGKSNFCELLQGVDVVIHLAARVHVMKETVVDALGAYRDINVQGTLELARAAAAAGVHRFIYLSSIKVNGESTPLGHPFTADDKPSPEDPYGLSKLETELALKELGRVAGMEVVIIRPPLVYGPGVGANFAAMMKILSYGVPLPFGAIHNMRSMVGLDNLVDLILTCVTHPHAAGQVFLAGDGQNVSLTSLLRKLILLMKVRTLLVPVPRRLLSACAISFGKRDVATRLCKSLEVDIQKTCDILDWTPPFTLDQGLKKTVNWYLKK